MSEKYQIVPVNRKTLFLRNIEMYMIKDGILENKDLRKFRNKTCNDILCMLNLFIEDQKNNSIEYLSRTYQYDSYVIRNTVTRRILSNT